MSGWSAFWKAMTDELEKAANDTPSDESNKVTTVGVGGRDGSTSAKDIPSGGTSGCHGNDLAANRRMHTPAVLGNESGRRTPEDKQEEVPSWAYFARGAAALGGLALVGYGAKKLYDHLSDESHQTLVGDDESHQTLAGDDPGYESSFCYERLSLQEELERYYQRHVNITASDMAEAQGIVDEVIGEVQGYLQSKYPSLKIGAFQQVGSTKEDLKVVAPDEFDFMVPIGLDPNVWKLENAGHRPSHKAPGFWLLRKIHGSVSDLEKFVDEENCLSPARMRNSFQGSLASFSHTYSGRYHRVTVSIHGPSVTLTVDSSKQKLSIDIVPTVSLCRTGQPDKRQKVKIVGKPHPETRLGEESAYDACWRRSFSEDEGKKLNRFTDGACHKKCLKILKTIRLRNAQMRALTSYDLKTVLLHRMRDTVQGDWSHSSMEDCFVGLVKALHDFVKEGCLPHFFTEDVNLLSRLQSDHDENALFNLEKYLARVIRKEDFVSFLKYDSTFSNF